MSDAESLHAPAPQSFDGFGRAQRSRRVGALIVGLAGNNGSTLASLLRMDRANIEWPTRHGPKHVEWYGSLLQMGTAQVRDPKTGDVCAQRLRDMPLPTPLVRPADIVVGGWDIERVSMVDAVCRSGVFDASYVQAFEALSSSSSWLRTESRAGWQAESQDWELFPGVWNHKSTFIAKNQSDRATWTLQGPLFEQLEAVEAHIADFRERHDLDTVVVMWSASTERFCDAARFGTEAALLAEIMADSPHVPPSVVYAAAAMRQGCVFLNGAPQNTLVPAIEEMARRHGGRIGGSDFKTGQTKLKSALTDFFAGSGVPLRSVVSYNHLGNNDGRNLSQAEQFESKRESKGGVLDDMVADHPHMYPRPPDHEIVIKYVPHVGDSKRAMDEYTAELATGEPMTLVLHTTCPDSLLAAPVMLDLIVAADFLAHAGESGAARPVLEELAFFFKRPEFRAQRPSNSFGVQRQMLVRRLLAASCF